MKRFLSVLVLLAPAGCYVTIPADLSGLRAGVISVTTSGDTLAVRWPDESAHIWTAEFSLDPAKPLISRIVLQDRVMVKNARPEYGLARASAADAPASMSSSISPATTPMGPAVTKRASRLRMPRPAPWATASRSPSTASRWASSMAASPTRSIPAVGTRP